MSYTEKSYGFIAELIEPILDKELREEVSEVLYESATGLRINYEGTLIYINHNHDGDRDDIYGLTIGHAWDTGKFLDSLRKMKIEIDLGSIQPYDEIWHNGSDSTIDLLLLSEFRDMTKDMI